MAAKTRAVESDWAERFRREGMHSLTEQAFVLAGDGSPQQLEAYRDQTVRPAIRALSASFFKTPPDQPVLILLFEEDRAYRRLSREWLGQTAVPHFGYFLQQRRVMVMNVGTGTGTLVHELVHALIAADFPAVPDWFNEGLASLYEQSTFTADGKEILGLPNWRLPALQAAIRENRLRPIRDLLVDRDFREEGRVALNYAQARYFLMYLQEKGLLVSYYQRFKENVKADPQGWEALRSLVGAEKLEAFEREWREWVMSLRV